MLGEVLLWKQAPSSAVAGGASILCEEPPRLCGTPSTAVPKLKVRVSARSFYWWRPRPASSWRCRDARDIVDRIAAGLGRASSGQPCRRMLSTCFYSAARTRSRTPWATSESAPAERPALPVRCLRRRSPSSSPSAPRPKRVALPSAPVQLRAHAGLSVLRSLRTRPLGRGFRPGPRPTVAEPTSETIEVVDHDTDRAAPRIDLRPTFVTFLLMRAYMARGRRGLSGHRVVRAALPDPRGSCTERVGDLGTSFGS